MFFLSKNKNKLFKFTVLFTAIDFSQFHTQKKFKPSELFEYSKLTWQQTIIHSF